MTPLTQILAACAMSAVIVVALWPEPQQGGQTVGGFVAFITAMLMTLPPIRHLADVMAPILRGLTALERSVDLVEDGITERGGTHSVPRAERPHRGRRGDAALSRRPGAGARRLFAHHRRPARRWRWSAPRAPASRRW